jgi:hypothetical protein
MALTKSTSVKKASATKKVNAKKAASPKKADGTTGSLLGGVRASRRRHGLGQQQVCAVLAAEVSQCAAGEPMFDRGGRRAPRHCKAASLARVIHVVAEPASEWRGVDTEAE